jgi:succinate dehydrogenase / fumarate reductase cytochrome b subunit
MILGFQVWWVAAFYLIAQALLFVHLGHGLAAMFQSLGLRNHVWFPRIRLFSKVVSIVIFIGYVSIPTAIYLRIIGSEYGEKAKAELRAAALVEPAVAQGKETK